MEDTHYLEFRFHVPFRRCLLAQDFIPTAIFTIQHSIRFSSLQRSAFLSSPRPRYCRSFIIDSESLQCRRFCMLPNCDLQQIPTSLWVRFHWLLRPQGWKKKHLPRTEFGQYPLPGSSLSPRRAMHTIPKEEEAFLQSFV
jgi:hypothetical protein